MKRHVKFGIGAMVTVLVMAALLAAYALPGAAAQKAAATATSKATGSPAATTTAEATTEATIAATAVITSEITPTLASTVTLTTPTPGSAAPAAKAVAAAPAIKLTGLLELPAQSEPRTISVVGEGAVMAVPDIAYATIGVETISDTVKLAANENARVMTAVTKALVAQGIAEADIQTSNLSVYSERLPAAGENATGRLVYHVSNSAQITIRKLGQVSAVLDAAIEAGANSIGGVYFEIADPKPLVAQAREKAMADALAKATDLARLANAQLGAIMHVSEPGISGGVVTMAEAYGRGGGAPISPGQMEITDQVQVVYEITVGATGLEGVTP